MKIRQEVVADYSIVYRLVQSAFSTAEYSDGNEQELVVRLRKSDAFIPELSLVAVEKGQIVGHILFTKAKLGGETVVVLAPLSVAPTHQKKGIGGALIKQGHEIAKAMGYRFSVVLGSADYYPRFGYRAACEFEIWPPFEVDSKHFMALPLAEDPGKMSAVLHYASAFFEEEKGTC